MRSALEAASSPEGPKASDILVEELGYTGERLDELWREIREAATTGNDKCLQVGAALELILDTQKPPPPLVVNSGEYYDEDGEWKKLDPSKYKTQDLRFITRRLEIGVEAISREAAESIAVISDEKTKKFVEDAKGLERAIAESETPATQKEAQKEYDARMADARSARKLAREQRAKSNTSYRRLECGMWNYLRVSLASLLFNPRSPSFPLLVVPLILVSGLTCVKKILFARQSSFSWRRISRSAAARRVTGFLP